MATAKQKAWRKKFAAMAKSGKLKKKKKRKTKTVRLRSKTSSCAASLGRKGGKKTYSLGHGIFADVYKKKRKSKKRKKSARKRKR